MSQRTKLGLIALALLLVGIPLLPWPDTFALGGGLVRVGIVLGAVWFALPNFMQLLSRIPKWLAIATVAGACIVAFRWQTIVFVGPILLVLWVIGPRWLSRRSK